MLMVARQGLLACMCLLSAVPALADPAADAVCRRLLPDAAITKDLGSGYTLRDLTEDGPTWRCLWEAGPDTDKQRLNVGFQPTSDSTKAFNDFIARMKRTNTAVEPLPGVGSAASILTFGTSFIVGGRTSGAFFSVGTTNLTRAEVTAIAVRLGQVADATIAAARTALADVKANPGVPAPPLADVVVRRGGLRLPCEQLLPREEIVAILGDYHLTYANDPRPDFSTCEWKRTEKDYAVTFSTRGPAEFRDAQVNGPAEYLAAELRMVNCSGEPGNGVVKGIGLDARVCGQGRHFTALIRRAKDVLTLICPDCTREQAIALARAAAQ